LDETKLQVQDRERLEGKLADAYRWLENDGLKAVGENRFEEIFVFMFFFLCLYLIQNWKDLVWKVTPVL